MTTGIRTASGRALSEVTLDALRAGTLERGDLRISREQLEAQAAAADGAGLRQLAENLRRAAELTAVANDRVFAIYERLRPGRATHAELVTLAQELAEESLPRLAAFVREAADAYAARDIVKPLR